MDSDWQSITLGINTFQYSTDEIMGKGMFGIVNPAKLLLNGQVVNGNLCVKRLKNDDIDEKQKQRINRENEVLEKVQNLGNQNIVPTYCITSDDKWLYIFMERCSEGDLKELMRNRQNNFSYQEVIKIIGSIVNGYKGLQIYSIIHRDLKPENIIINREKVYGSEKETQLVFKLSDFGFSRVIEEAMESQAQKLTKIGTPQYMSPQMILNLPYREKADVYSLGMIAHQLLHKGSLPYQAPSLQGLQNIVKNLEKKPHTCEMCPSANAPQELIKLIESMLRFHEIDRPSWQELCKHPLLKVYISQKDHNTNFVRKDMVTTNNKDPLSSQIQSVATHDRGLKNIEQTKMNNTLQDSMFFSDQLPVGEKLTKSQRIEKFIKILLKKGDQAFEAMLHVQSLFTYYPLYFDIDFSLLLVVLVSYKYNTLLSCFGLLTFQQSYVTPKITSIVKWESLQQGLNEICQTNSSIYNQYKDSVYAQIQYFYGLQNDLIRDYIQRTKGFPQEPWISQMLNNITNDYSPYLDAISYLHQTKIRSKLNSLQSLVIPHPNQMVVFKIYYYLEMITRIDLKFPFSQYLHIDEESIGDIPVDDELCKELTNIYQQPLK